MKALAVGLLFVSTFWYAVLLATVAAATPAIVFEQEATVQEPAGNVVTHPALSKVDVCAGNGATFIYDLATRTMLVPKPCNNLFTDGFE